MYKSSSKQTIIGKQIEAKQLTLRKFKVYRVLLVSEGEPRCRSKAVDLCGLSPGSFFRLHKVVRPFPRHYAGIRCTRVPFLGYLLFVTLYFMKHVQTKAMPDSSHFYQYQFNEPNEDRSCTLSNMQYICYITMW
jgi:hypothetical protein